MEASEIHSRMRSAGIPKEAISTTLAKEKCQVIRTYIADSVFETKPIVYLSPLTATLPFYLTAKELLLAGRRVFSCRLVDIHTALFKDTDEAESLSSALEVADFIAIEGFYDAGGRSDPFFTPYEAAYFVSWFIRRNQSGAGFVLLGSMALPFAEEWWPASLIHYISRRCQSFSVDPSRGATNE